MSNDILLMSTDRANSKYLSMATERSKLHHNLVPNNTSMIQHREGYYNLHKHLFLLLSILWPVGQAQVEWPSDVELSKQR